jgi:hypothetical protein
MQRAIAWTLLFVVGITCWLAPAVHGQRPNSQDRPATTPQGGETPEQVVQKYFTFLIAGDEEGMLSLYDQSTKFRKSAAKSMALAARVVGKRIKIERAVGEKFGEAGDRVLREELDIDNSAAKIAELDFEDQQFEIYYHQSNSKAVAHVPQAKQEYWQLEKIDGRWYLAATKAEAVGGAFAAIVFTKMEQEFEKILGIIDESESVAQLQSRLQKFHDESQAKSQLPEVDVEGPDVDVTVPDVTVEVPGEDANGEQANGEQGKSVEVPVPDVDVDVED